MTRQSTATIRQKGEAAPAGTAEKSAVQSLAKGLRILECFTAGDEPLTVTEIAERTSLDPGTAFRMLNTLVAAGYVVRSDKRRYALTLKVLDLGFNAIGRTDIRTVARPVLRSLVGEKVEAASFGVLQGSNVIYVERIRAGVARLGVDIRIGTAIPAPVNILGQAILAFLPPDDLEIALNNHRSDVTGYPVVSRARLLPQLETIRAQGYALQQSLITAGLVVLAAPVRDADGYPMGAVSIAAPSVVCGVEELLHLSLQPLLKAASGLSQAMQTSGSTRTG